MSEKQRIEGLEAATLLSAYGYRLGVNTFVVMKLDGTYGVRTLGGCCGLGDDRHAALLDLVDKLELRRKETMKLLGRNLRVRDPKESLRFVQKTLDVLIQHSPETLSGGLHDLWMAR